jgi:alkane 1-monooxygenase
MLWKPSHRNGGRFFLAWTLPWGIAGAAWHSPEAAAAAMVLFQATVAVLETLPRWRSSPAPAPGKQTAHRWVLRGHVLWQMALLGACVGWVATRGYGSIEAAVLGLAVGGVTGALGITFAHELGHSKWRLDRGLGWLLMASVNYAHFMVEHYRGHHPRAATAADPASAREGETLWRFLPRTLAGSWRSAWRLEAEQLARMQRPWWRSALLGAALAQAALLVGLFALFGLPALLFWLCQSAYAVFQLETINYIEHYGLQRQAQPHHPGRAEPFGINHAWNADHWLTNAYLINLQRHSDHHMHAWKPYPSLEALPGPQLPTGYAGCILLATVPRLWFALMHPRLAALRRRLDSAATTRPDSPALHSGS